MNITGMLAVGNGEKCPYCDDILDDRENQPGDKIFDHMKNEHPDEFMASLFPEDGDSKK